MSNPRDELINAARAFAQLADEPEPSAATWHEAMERAYQRLRRAVEAEQAARPTVEYTPAPFSIFTAPTDPL